MQAGKYFATGQPQVYLSLPILGEYTRGILQDLGFHMDEIDHLFLKHVVF